MDDTNTAVAVEIEDPALLRELRGVMPAVTDAPAAEARAEETGVAPAPKKASPRVQAIIDAADRLRAVNARRGAPFLPPPPPQKRRQDVLELADQAQDIKTVAGVILDEVDRRVIEAGRALDAKSQNERIQAREAEFRETHPDYDELLRESGIFEGAARHDDGTLVNPALGYIFDSSDPVARAYEAAREILESKGRVFDAPSSQSQTRGRPAAQPEPDAPRTPRPRGINNLPSAGEQSISFDRESIDALPDATRQRLFEKRPDLKDFWLGA